MAEEKVKSRLVRPGVEAALFEARVKKDYPHQWDKATATIEVTKAGWGSESLVEGDQIEVEQKDASWFDAQYGERTSGQTQPLYIAWINRPTHKAPPVAAIEPETAPVRGRRGR